MKKNIYLTVLAIVTVICVISGTCYHVFRWGFSIAENFVPFLVEGKKEQAGPVQESGEIKLDDFTSIDADVSVMDLDIVSGDQYSISYSANEKLIPEYEVQDSRLVIKQKQKKLWGNKKCSVTITVPVELGKVELDASVGDIDLKGISVSDLEIDASVGDVKITGCTLKEATVDASTGDIGFSNTAFDTLEVDASVGNVDLDSAVDLSVYSVILDTSVGSVSVNGQDYKRRYSHNGSQSGKSLTVDCSVGDIELNY